LSEEKRSPRSQDERGPLLLTGVLLALVKYDCQPVVGDSGVMLLTPWIQTNINFRGRHNRAAIKNLDLKDLEILATTQDFQKQVAGHGLTTANILYRCRDHPWLRQSYVGQNYYLYSSFPEQLGSLEFWQKSLEGVLHSVTVAHSRLARPAEWMAFSGSIDRRLD
jgi:uncharacterized protein Usg